jgi:hypothetical protein
MLPLLYPSRPGGDELYLPVAALVETVSSLTANVAEVERLSFTLIIVAKRGYFYKRFFYLLEGGVTFPLSAKARQSPRHFSMKRDNFSKYGGSTLSARPHPQILKVGSIISIIALMCLVLWLQNEQPFDISLQEAHYNTEKWLGKQVRIKGRVQKFEGMGGLHYVVEDDNFNRVALRNVSPQQLEEAVGQLATVVGSFQFEESAGIFILAKTFNL